MAATDNRDTPGGAGTNRVKTLGRVDSEKIGNLEGGTYTETSSDASHRLQRASCWNGSAWVQCYSSGTVQTKTAAPSADERVVDVYKCHWPENRYCYSKIRVKAAGKYPFAFLAPNINYDVTWHFYKCGTDVWVKSTGSHNEFPAYEDVLNGSLVYSDMPTSSGPGIFNLGVFWDEFETDWVKVQ
jgi:hypothetical protein